MVDLHVSMCRLVNASIMRQGPGWTSESARKNIQKNYVGSQKVHRHRILYAMEIFVR